MCFTPMCFKLHNSITTFNVVVSTYRPTVITLPLSSGDSPHEKSGDCNMKNQNESNYMRLFVL